MKKVRILFLLFAVCTPFLASAGPDEIGSVFHQAVCLSSNGDYKEALSIFKDLKRNDEIAGYSTKNLDAWITYCTTKERQRQKNAVAAAQRLNKRIENNLVFISVNLSMDDVAGTKIGSDLSNTLRRKGFSFTESIGEACTVVTAIVETQQETKPGGLYVVNSKGYLRFGSALNSNKYFGNYTSDWKDGKSYESMAIALEQSYRKLGEDLSSALVHLVDGTPLPAASEILLNNTIVIKTVGDDLDLSSLTQKVGSYITKDGTFMWNPTNDEKYASALAEEYLRQAHMTKREQRTPIGEQDGIKYLLFLEVNKNDNQYTFSGTVVDLSTGIAVGTSGPLSITLRALTKEYQEFAAAMVSASLGIKKWKIGETFFNGKVKLARVPFETDETKEPGLLCYVIRPDYQKWFPYEPKINPNGNNTSNYVLNKADSENARYWRYPSADELASLAKYKSYLHLSGIYWTETRDKKGKPIAFELDANAERVYNCKKAATVIVREFDN